MLNRKGSTGRSRAYAILAIAVVVAMLVSACGGAAGPAAPEAAAPAAAPATEAAAAAAPAAATEAPAAPVEASGDDMTTVFGVELPADALPYSEQVYREPCDITANHITFDFAVSVYQRFCGNGHFSDQLVSLDKDFNVIPASAESWEVSEDGLTWTFHIKPGLVWSDGTPFTAHDYVATFQYEADPEHAWDFAWYYAGVLENWDAIIAGELPKEELGVKALDDLTLEITTAVPWPPLPAMMVFSWPMQKKALEEHGPLYNSDAATSVSSGPFMLESVQPGQEVVMVANPTYKGFRPPLLSKYIVTYMNTATFFAAFQNDEIYKVQYEWLTPADFELIQNDPVLSENYLRHYGDFRTDYLLFDTFNPPFNDLNVRKAFAHAVDREAIVENVYTEIKALPAYAFLMPGFPASDTEGALKEYQTYDCEMAKQYLADAGFPDGEGFPALELWMRNEGAAIQAVMGATAASISECLNVQIQTSNKDTKVYMDALNADPTQLTFGGVSYGMDYMDPSNMLGIWVSTGRHSWKNDEFDSIVAEASSLVGDPDRRTEMFQEAEKILVDDVGGIFIAHRWQGDLVKPWLMGEGFREPDSQGIAAFHWENNSAISTMYLAQH